MENAVSEEPEEGEIIDDFEDVSDSSIQLGSPINCGKCVSPELLSAVSLNSVNLDAYGPSSYVRGDTHIFYKKATPTQCRRKRKLSTRLPSKRHPKRRKPLASHSDSDNESVDPKYVKQLREALRRDSSDLLHNSLRTRLKGFIEPSSISEDELELRDLALLSTAKADEGRSESQEADQKQQEPKVEDSELQALRIEALRSFVLENHNKRKLKAQGGTVPSDGKESRGGTNKENVQGVINDVETPEAAPDLIEEDVDNLRALVLASMTDKLIEKTVKTNTVLQGDATSGAGNGCSLNITKTIKNDHYFGNMMKFNNVKPNLLNNMVVKPLIIQVGNESDSDMEELEPQTTILKQTVTEFLKKQRAKVEAKTTNGRLKQPIDQAKKQLVPVKPQAPQPKQQRPTAPTKTPQALETTDDFLDKSEVKLLPQSKQLEYKRLKLQLLNARRKNLRVRKPSLTKRETYANSNSSLKKVPKFTKTNVSHSKNSSPNSKMNLKPAGINGSPYKFHPALDGLQILKNGRLQMKGKYRSLGPLLNKVNQANSERTLHEKCIKGLLQEIQQVRSKLAVSHQQFTDYVQELVKKKNLIDQRSSSPLKAADIAGPTTSTPIKANVEQSTSRLDKVVEVAVEGEDKGEVQSKVLLDPNDIMESFSKNDIANEEGVLKYTSPLDKRFHISDPHVMMCPYDLLGVCKDNECAYLHCS